MPDSSPFWLCHECGAQMRPITIDGVPHCASCNGEFLEILDADVNPDPFHDLPPPPPTRPGVSSSSPLSPGGSSDPGTGGSGFFSSLFGGLLGAGAAAGQDGSSSSSPTRNTQEGSYGNRAGSPTRPQQGGPRTWEFNFPGGGRGQVMFGSFGGNIGGGNMQMGPFGPIGDNGDPLASFFPGFNPPRPGVNAQRLGNPPAPGQPPDGLELLRALIAAVGEEGNAPQGLFFGGPAGRSSFGDYATSERGFNDILEQLMQAAGPQGPLPASDIVIDGLPRFKFDEKTLEQSIYKDCPVCKDDFAVGDEVMRIPCAHVFHPDCLQPWLKVNGSCPVCRFSLVPQEPNQAPPAGPSQPTPQAQAQTQAGGPNLPLTSPTEGGQSTMTSVLNRLFGQSGSTSNPTSPGVAESPNSPFGALGTPAAQSPPPQATSSGLNARQSAESRFPANQQDGRENVTSPVPTSDQAQSPDQPLLSTAIPEDYRARHRERERQQHEHEDIHDHYLDLD